MQDSTRARPKMGRVQGSITGGNTFVGRGAELSRGVQTLRSLDTGKPGLVVIEGEAGIGKTRLLEEILQHIEHRVLRTKCDELDRSRPLGSLIDAVPATDRNLVRSLSIDSLSADPAERFRLTDSFVELLEGYAIEEPVVLAVDDLQWADEVTIAVLRTLVTRLDPLPIGVVATTRPYPRPSGFSSLITSEGVTLIMLGPLGEDDVGRMTADLLDVTPGEDVRRIVMGAGGNPFYVRELLSGLADDEAIVVRDDVARTIAGGPPPSLRLTLLARLSYLPSGTTAILRTAALLGSTFTLNELAIAEASSQRAVVDALEPAMEARVVEDMGSAMRFRHDLIREAIYEDLSPSVRTAMHREAAGRLAAAGARATRVAEQFALGPEGEDALAAEWLMKAAAEAAADPATAVAFLERAKRCVPTRHVEPIDLALVPVLARAGRIDDSLATARALIDRSADHVVRMEARRILTELLVHAGRPEEAVAVSEAAVAEARTPSERATASIGLAASLADMSNYGDAIERAREAEAAAREAGDPLVESRAVGIQSYAHTNSWRWQESEQLGTRAVEIVQATERSDPAALAALAEAMTHHAYALLSSQTADPIPELRRAQAIFEGLGMTHNLIGCHDVVAWQLFDCSRWDEALAEWDALEAVAESLGVPTWPGMHHVAAYIGMRRGDDRLVRSAIAKERKRVGLPDAPFERILTCWVEAMIAARSDKERRHDMLQRCWEGGIGGLTAYCGEDIAYEAMRVELVGLAKELAERADRLVAVQASSASRAFAAHCHGTAEGDPDLLAEAAELYRSTPCRFRMARALEDAGVALWRDRRSGAAPKMLAEALSIYDEGGLRTDASRARNRIREQKMRVAGIGRRERPTTGWDALTKMERKVARLAAEGLTNPQIAEQLFISRRTVESHLSHAFAKLEVDSRVQLAVKAARER